MKRLLFFFCILAIQAHAQIPEVGMSAEKITKLMSGKYSFCDTIITGNIKPRIEKIRFAPVNYFGAQWLVVTVFDEKMICKKVVCVSEDENKLPDEISDLFKNVPYYVEADFEEILKGMTAIYGRCKKQTLPDDEDKSKNMYCAEWRNANGLISLYLTSGNLMLSQDPEQKSIFKQ